MVFRDEGSEPGLVENGARLWGRVVSRGAKGGLVSPVRHKGRVPELVGDRLEDPCGQAR